MDITSGAARCVVPKLLVNDSPVEDYHPANAAADEGALLKAVDAHLRSFRGREDNVKRRDCRWGDVGPA